MMKYLRQDLLDEKNRKVDTLTEADEQHITVRAEGKEIVTVKYERGKVSVSVAGGKPVYVSEEPEKSHAKPLEGAV